MKKVWNAPDVQELTIQSTAFGHYKGHGKGDGSNKGDNFGNDFGGNGFGGNACRCKGGTSPCEFHHFGEDDQS